MPYTIPISRSHRTPFNGAKQVHLREDGRILPLRATRCSQLSEALSHRLRSGARGLDSTKDAVQLLSVGFLGAGFQVERRRGVLAAAMLFFSPSILRTSVYPPFSFFVPDPTRILFNPRLQAPKKVRKARTR
ncbi:hypothetical protein PENSPDRAFT_755370 [Peniophora sp. CONT]|nr:hypothetical protein PENSPDRAFT_755370 [Peniophora sp. CONT]